MKVSAFSSSGQFYFFYARWNAWHLFILFLHIDVSLGQEETSIT